MGPVRRISAPCRALTGLAAFCGLLALLWAHAAAAEESIDDPKLARRLGTRIDWVSPPASAPTLPSVATPAAPGVAPGTSPPVGQGTAPPAGQGTAPPAGQGAPATAASGAPPPATPPAASPTTSPPVASPVTPLPPAAPTATPATPSATPAIAAASSTPAATPPVVGEPAFAPVLPRLQLAFRRFDFVRIGASDSNGLPTSEAFDTLSLDVYPMSSLVRLGLSTAYGWQAGMTSGGDYFATETASFGPQLDFGRVVPFAEALAGIGYMRRLQFDHTIPTVFWQLGIDLGASVYFARIGFVSLALGYLRPVNGFLRSTSFESVYTNTWSFKIGIGI